MRIVYSHISKMSYMSWSRSHESVSPRDALAQYTVSKIYELEYSYEKIKEIHSNITRVPACHP